MVRADQKKQVQRELDSLVLDFDGVLVGLDGHTKARVQAFEEFAEQTGDERFLVGSDVHEATHEHGSHPEEIIGWILEQAGLVPAGKGPKAKLTKEVVGLKSDLYRALCEKGLEALPGAIDLVNWATDKIGPMNMAIVTTAHMWEVDPFLERYNLEESFSWVITRELVPSETMLKPHPWAYEFANNNLPSTRSRRAAIEDSPYGLRAAQEANIYAVGITTTHTTAQLAPHADIILPDLEAVKKLNWQPVRH